MKRNIFSILMLSAVSYGSAAITSVGFTTAAFTSVAVSSLAFNSTAKAAESDSESESSEEEMPVKKKKEKSKKRNYEAPFGMAGCGLGSMIIDKKDKNSQLLASLINTYIGFVSSAITSGTSNCNYVNNTAMEEQKVYLTANIRTIEKEAAIGKGPHLEALAQLFGCEERESMAAFRDFNKAEYNRLYNSENPEKVWENMKEIGKSSEIAKICNGVG